jgi:hypothetical protein
VRCPVFSVTQRNVDLIRYNRLGDDLTDGMVSSSPVFRLPRRLQGPIARFEEADIITDAKRFLVGHSERKACSSVTARQALFAVLLGDMFLRCRKE